MQEQMGAFGSEIKFFYQRAMQPSVRTDHKWKIPGKMDSTAKDLDGLEYGREEFKDRANKAPRKIGDSAKR